MQRFAKGLAAWLAVVVSAAVATIALAWMFELLYRLTKVSFFATALVIVSPLMFGWLVLVVFIGLFLVLFWRLFGLRRSRAPSNSTIERDARNSGARPSL
jgi:uncharacterized membrane protein